MYLLPDTAASAGGEKTVLRAVRPDIKIDGCHYHIINARVPQEPPGVVDEVAVSENVDRF
jgi:hypothetical protein